MLGIFAACDRDNFGDLLYPVITEKMLEKHAAGTELATFAFLDGAAPGEAGFDVKDINRALQGYYGSLALLVGGGDILRTDTRTLASHYEKEYLKVKLRNILNKIRYKLFGCNDLVSEFQQRFLSYSTIGPYLIDKSCFPALENVYYCSCGVPFPFTEAEKDGVRRVMGKASFIYVRDAQSANKLLDAGVGNAIHVAPDLIVCLSDFYQYGAEKEKGRKILQQFGVDTGKRIICFQTHRHFFLGDEQELLKELRYLQETLGYEVVLMPIGYCHGDDYSLQWLASIAEIPLKYIPAYSIHDMISILAASDAFVGTSLHGNITAFSFGLPHVFGPAGIDKAEGFLNIAGLPQDLKMGRWSELSEKLEFAFGLGEDFRFQRLEESKRKVHETFRELAAVYATDSASRTA